MKLMKLDPLPPVGILKDKRKICLGQENAGLRLALA